jgi:hypothetical protein
MMCRMEALSTAFPESESVAWLETTIRRGHRIRKTLRPSDADIQTLIALRMQQDLGELDGSLERLQALGCIAWDEHEYPALTPRGLDVLRRWLS